MTSWHIMIRCADNRMGSASIYQTLWKIIAMSQNDHNPDDYMGKDMNKAGIGRTL